MDVNKDVTTALAKIATLRDEVRLHLHLASLDAKKEWDEVLEPRVLELSDNAKQLGDDVREKATDVAGKLEAFVARLRDAAMTKKQS